jgi:hypothetical protein
MHLSLAPIICPSVVVVSVQVIVEEGFHFRVPWFQRPIIYDIRAKPHTFVSPTGTKGECELCGLFCSED